MMTSRRTQLCHSSFWRPGSPWHASRAHGFASPPYDGFAFVEDVEVTRFGFDYTGDRLTI